MAFVVLSLPSFIGALILSGILYALDKLEDAVSYCRWHGEWLFEWHVDYVIDRKDKFLFYKDDEETSAP